jgi:hypothetical protein
MPSHKDSQKAWAIQAARLMASLRDLALAVPFARSAEVFHQYNVAAALV